MPNQRLAIWLKQFVGTAGWGPLGPLEYAIMSALWARSPMIVRELQPLFPKAAYTTLQTTLARLQKKGLLRCEQRGLANAYWPAMTRQELGAAIADLILRSDGS
jgi:predicted transcriptional regulator